MRISTVLLLIPIVIIAAIIAVANRQMVTFSLDPLSTDYPSVAFTLPLYLLVFFSILFGVLLGGASVILRRTRRRRAPDLAPVAKNSLPPAEPPTARERQSAA